MIRDAYQAKRLKSDFVYDEIIHAIARGNIRSGALITVDMAAAACRTSTIPVREAFVRLQTDGLITHRNSGGFFVADTSFGELKGAYKLIGLIAQNSLNGMSVGQARSAGLKISRWLHASKEAGQCLQEDPVTYEAALTCVARSLSCPVHEATLMSLLRRTSPFRIGVFAERHDLKETQAFVSSFATDLTREDCGAAQKRLQQYLCQRSEKISREYEIFVG